jgi:hypothetical protein
MKKTPIQELNEREWKARKETEKQKNVKPQSVSKFLPGFVEVGVGS